MGGSSGRRRDLSDYPNYRSIHRQVCVQNEVQFVRWTYKQHQQGGSENEKELFEKSLKHPIYGELNLYQWVQFLDLHEQRHLTQLKEAKHAILQR